MHHPKQKGQSVQKYRLTGGTHWRTGPDGRRDSQTPIRAGDSLHITREEADKFSDRWELVRTVSADSVEFDDAMPNSGEVIEMITEDASVDEIEDTLDEDEGGTISPSDPLEGPGSIGEDDEDIMLPAVELGLDRQDFSSDAAFKTWTEGGELDMDRVQKSGHGGRTYSVSDVRGVVGG